MIQSSIARPRKLTLRFVRDFVIGLGLFAMMAALATRAPEPRRPTALPLFGSSAYAASQSAPTVMRAKYTAAPAVYRSTDSRQATIILGLAFAALLAFNLAVVRHLRRVYASPR
jgi:hypothetical protein